MRYLITILLLTACNSSPDYETVKKENNRLQNEVDSLRNELHKCDMLLEAYEGMPMTL